MNRFLKRKGDDRESFEKSRKVVVRKYDPEYIKYDFTNAGTDLEPKAQCGECAQILSNEALTLLGPQLHTVYATSSFIGY